MATSARVWVLSSDDLQYVEPQIPNMPEKYREYYLAENSRKIVDESVICYKVMSRTSRVPFMAAKTLDIEREKKVDRQELQLATLLSEESDIVKRAEDELLHQPPLDAET